VEAASHLADCPAEGAAAIAAVEDRHFWFGARARLIAEELRAVLGPLSGRSVVDIGCGTGFVLAVLEQAGMVSTGCDMHESALDYARRRTVGALFLADASDLPSSQFDAALLCDVIEHAEDDLELLRTAKRTVRPGGVVLVTVPAQQWLWTSIDEISGHKRRYSLNQLSAVMKQAGLSSVKGSYFNRLLLPAQALRKLRLVGVKDPKDIREVATTLPPRWLNQTMAFAMQLDGRLPGRIPGASIIGTGRV